MGSEHNFLASSFHKYCDNKGQTLSVILSDKQRLFGGFTKANWDIQQHGKYSVDNEAFLIQFNERIKLKHKNNGNNAIYNHNTHMSTFGEGHDIFIYDQANTNNSSASNLGTTYEIPQGKDNTWLAGSYNFKVLEIEVYTVKIL